MTRMNMDMNLFKQRFSSIGKGCYFVGFGLCLTLIESQIWAMTGREPFGVFIHDPFHPRRIRFVALVALSSHHRRSFWFVKIDYADVMLVSSMFKAS